MTRPMLPHGVIHEKPIVSGYLLSMQSSMVFNPPHDTESQALRRRARGIETQSQNAKSQELKVVKLRVAPLSSANMKNILERIVHLSRNFLVIRYLHDG